MSDYRPMGQFGIGQPIKRFEDVRLVRGDGRFHDDVNVSGQVHAVIVRSIHAHARILAIDVARALRAPGVLAVFTGSDVAHLGTMKMLLKRKRPAPSGRGTRASSATRCTPTCSTHTACGRRSPPTSSTSPSTRSA